MHKRYSESTAGFAYRLHRILVVKLCRAVVDLNF
jgi:hypothetical protein